MSRSIIALASDHRGYALKGVLRGELESAGHGVLDLGTDSDEAVDYPDYGYAAAQAIADGRAARAVVICGTGIGIAIAANRHPAVRAAVCHEPEAARLARRHNDVNVLALASNELDENAAREILRTFLETGFEGGRHQARVAKLGAPEIETQAAPLRAAGSGK
ncbi:MAG: ribose 5-phosphate isomerase B [Proteobacteria bacterium]|nr:ribose 5-phosphate isomerase B [Pseudomonadota bacterium]